MLIIDEATEARLRAAHKAVPSSNGWCAECETSEDCPVIELLDSLERVDLHCELDELRWWRWQARGERLDNALGEIGTRFWAEWVQSRPVGQTDLDPAKYAAYDAWKIERKAIWCDYLVTEPVAGRPQG